jgi:hypothetical protein
MAAQKAAGLMARGAAATGDDNWQRGSKTDPRRDDETSPITLAAAGIGKHLVARAAARPPPLPARLAGGY